MIAYHRSGAVRIAVLFLALFGCTVVAAFALTYTLVREEIVLHLRSNIVAGADAIAARLAHEPPDAVLTSSSRQRVAALYNPDGTLVFGEPGLSPFIGWRCRKSRNSAPRWCSAMAGSWARGRSWSARAWTSWRIPASR
jgi:hypothetical protein